MICIGCTSWRCILLLALAGCGGDPAPEPAAGSPAPPAAEAPSAPATEARSAAAVGSICPDPGRPCPGFRPHDLSFVLPMDEVARAEVRSEPFYAVILRSAPECGIAAAEGEAVQADFPGRKVFVQRTECEGDMENNVGYTEVAPGMAFMAVYAGVDRAEADSLLQALPGGGRFPGANLRRMQVVFMYP